MIEDSEWWEFFPSSLSPFGYNETTAHEYYPLDRNSSNLKWFKWSNYEYPDLNVEKVIPANKLPENIGDIPDDILNWAIECDVTNRPFRITAQELDFYRKNSIPIPKIHPDQRHIDRLAKTDPRKIYHRICDNCSVDIQSCYSEEKQKTVYCEICYNSEIY